MTTYAVTCPGDGATLMTTQHLSCLPSPESLASMYAAGLLLLENGRKTTATRRKELMALRAKALKGE